MITSGKKIKVLIVDDSPLVRKILSEVLSEDSDIEIVGTAPDPYIARDMLLRYEPDVITLDIEMPRMDGVTFLKKIMTYKPTPVIIISSLTQGGSEKAMECLKLGAVDVVGKPSGSYSVGDMKTSLANKVKAAAKSHCLGCKTIETKFNSIDLAKTYRNIIAIGASTGGTEAIKNVLMPLPSNTPGIVITQHMPPYFTKAFADRLSKITSLEVREAKNMDRVMTGRALIAPGGFHMIVRRDINGYYVLVKDGPKVNYQKPSVDIMFKSIAKCSRDDALGVILTGMGRDGAEGLYRMKETGSFNIAQDEETSVVFGMPKVAIEYGGVNKIVPLKEIAKEIIIALKRKKA